MRPDGRILTCDPQNRQPEDGCFHGHQNGITGFIKELIDEFARPMFQTPDRDPSRPIRFHQLKVVHNLVFVHKHGELCFD